MTRTKICLTCLSGALLSCAAHAGVTQTVDFSMDDNGNAIGNGQIIDSEFFSDFTLSSSGSNAGMVAFDSTTGVNSADPDLWVDSGMVLTLQEDNDSSNDGSFFDNPNDDGDGGIIVFDFTAAVELVSIDLIDINGNGPATLTLTDGNGNTRVYNVPMEWTGDPSEGDPGIGTLDLTSIADQPGWESTATASQDVGFSAIDVVKLEVDFMGSQALDNLVYNVPAPGALALLGLAAIRRRRRSA